jgi:hypothetical protein
MCREIEYYDDHIESHDLSRLYLSKLINKLARGEDLARLEQVALESDFDLEIDFNNVAKHCIINKNPSMIIPFLSR